MHEHKNSCRYVIRGRKGRSGTVICGRSGRIGYRASRRGTVKVALALCRRSKPTNVRNRVFHVKQSFRLPMIYQLHAVERSFDRYRSGTNVIRGKKVSSIGKLGHYKTECFTWNTVSTKQQMTFERRWKPEMWHFLCLLSGNRVIIGGSTGYGDRQEANCG